jgi:hypothetical protein
MFSKRLCDIARVVECLSLIQSEYLSAQIERILGTEAKTFSVKSQGTRVKDSGYADL